MSERLVELAKELQQIAKDKNMGIYISVDRFKRYPPLIHTVSKIETVFDIKKPYESVFLETATDESNGVKLITDAYYFKNTEDRP